MRAYARAARAEPAHEHAEPNCRLDARAAAPVLAAALAALSPTDREVLLLFAWADLSCEQIAEAVGIPVGTVRSRMNRARHKVRDRLTSDRALSVLEVLDG